MPASNLPPGCTLQDIERAAGAAGPEDCLNCGTELTEENDPQGYGVCSPECVWPAIGKQAQRERLDEEAAEAAYLAWLADRESADAFLFLGGD